MTSHAPLCLRSSPTALQARAAPSFRFLPLLLLLLLLLPLLPRPPAQQRPRDARSSAQTSLKPLLPPRRRPARGTGRWQPGGGSGGRGAAAVDVVDVVDVVEAAGGCGARCPLDTEALSAHGRERTHAGRTNTRTSFPQDPPARRSEEAGVMPRPEVPRAPPSAAAAATPPSRAPFPAAARTPPSTVLTNTKHETLRLCTQFP